MSNGYSNINRQKRFKTLKFSEDIFSSLNNNPKMRYFEKTINFAYSSVVSVKNISKGEKLNIKNIWVKRLGKEIIWRRISKLLGKTTRFVPANKFIKKGLPETMKIAFLQLRDRWKNKAFNFTSKKKTN